MTVITAKSIDLAAKSLDLAAAYTADGLSYGDFRQLGRLARALGVTVADLVEAAR